MPLLRTIGIVTLALMLLLSAALRDEPPPTDSLAKDGQTETTEEAVPDDDPFPPDHGPFPVDLHILDDGGRILAHHAEWSLSPLANYWLMEHPVIPASNGTYHTFYRNGKAITKLEQRDGTETELPGVIQYADGHQAILLESVQGEEIVEQVLHLWRPGRNPTTTACKAPGSIHMTGSLPLAVSEEGDYYKYDAATDKWMFWESARSIRLSRQTFSGMYKKAND